MCRNKRSIVIDLESPLGIGVLLRLVEHADGFYEGFRPGVAHYHDTCETSDGKYVAAGALEPGFHGAGYSDAEIAGLGQTGVVGDTGSRPAAKD